LNTIAEEYYKNDYPDEESSDYDASEASDGASSVPFLLVVFSGSSSVYIQTSFMTTLMSR
jgi:hypothetical protein